MRAAEPQLRSPLALAGRVAVLMMVKAEVVKTGFDLNDKAAVL